MEQTITNYCYDCKNCALDMDGKHRCKNPQSYCYSEQRILLHSTKACELFNVSFLKQFKKPELMAKIKGE